jgi:hypothetical protein
VTKLKTARPCKYDPSESAVKLALDYAELVERVPELQREATAVNFDERGGLVLVPPRHPAVIAFIKELDEMEYVPAADLKTARRRLRVANDNYQTRVSFRLAHDDGSRAAFNRSVSLSAILIVRAAGRHWHKVVNELERAERIKTRNERAAQLVPRYVVIDGHPVRVRRERERPSP